MLHIFIRLFFATLCISGCGINNEINRCFEIEDGDNMAQLREVYPNKFISSSMDMGVKPVGSSQSFAPYPDVLTGISEGPISDDDESYMMQTYVIIPPSVDPEAFVMFEPIDFDSVAFPVVLDSVTFTIRVKTLFDPNLTLHTVEFYAVENAGDTPTPSDKFDTSSVGPHVTTVGVYEDFTIPLGFSNYLALSDSRKRNLGAKLIFDANPAWPPTTRPFSETRITNMWISVHGNETLPEPVESNLTIKPSIFKNSSGISTYNLGVVDTGGGTDVVPIISDGRINDGDDTYVFWGSGLTITDEFSFLFEDFNMPYDVENNTFNLVADIKVTTTGGSSIVPTIDCDVHWFFEESDTLDSDNFITTIHSFGGSSAVGTEYVRFTQEIPTDNLKNVPRNALGNFALVVRDLDGLASSKEYRITNMFLDITDNIKGGGYNAINNSMTIGDSSSVGLSSSILHESFIGGYYLGYEDYRMLILSSSVSEQTSTRTGTVLRGQQDGGVSNIYGKTVLNISLNCLILADSAEEQKYRMQNIKRIFKRGLQFMQLDRDNFGYSEDYQRGFYGMLVSPIVSRKSGLYNREFTLDIEVPSGKYISEKEYTFGFTFDDGQKIFPEDATPIVLDYVSKWQIPFPFHRVQYSVGLGSNTLLPSERTTDIIGGDFVPSGYFEISVSAGTIASVPISTIQLGNEALRQTLTWSGALIDTDTLIIDTANEKVLILDISGEYTDVTYGITSDSTFPELNPTSISRPDLEYVANTYLPETYEDNYITCISNWPKTTSELTLRTKWRRVF